MLISSKGIETLNAENSFLPGFKWDMGQIHMFFPKKILCHPTRVYTEGVQKGFPYIYKEPVSVAFKLLHEELFRAELMDDPTLGTDVIEEKVKVEMERITDEELFNKYNKYTSVAIHTNLCRKINVPNVFTNRVKVPVVRNKSEYTPTLLDKLYSLTKDIVNNKIDDTKKKLTELGTEDEVIKETVSSLKKNKPIGAKAFRYAIACPFLLCDANKNLITENLDENNMFALNIFTFNSDTADIITEFLHSDSDIFADFLPCQITHPMIKSGSSDKQKKGQSALKANVITIAKENVPTNQIPNFYDKLTEFYKKMVLDDDIIESSVYDFYTKSDSFLLETIKSWMVTQTQYITTDVQEKHVETLAMLNDVASNGEVEQIVNNTATPNTIYTQPSVQTQQAPQGQVQLATDPQQGQVQLATEQLQAQQPDLENIAISLNQ